MMTERSGLDDGNMTGRGSATEGDRMRLDFQHSGHENKHKIRVFNVKSSKFTCLKKR